MKPTRKIVLYKGSKKELSFEDSSFLGLKLKV